MHNRKRQGRGGLEPSPPPKLTKATEISKNIPEPQLTVFKASSPSRISSIMQITPSKPAATLTNTPTTISQGCNHFRTGLKNLNEFCNYVVASQELQTAVNLGHLESHARLALMYLSGYPHMPQNRTAAFKLAEIGSRFKNNCPHCLGVLAICYTFGYGVRKNGSTALKHALASCAKNSYVGQFAIATIYRDGNVVSTDLTKSFEFFGKAAAQNFPDAQYDIGLLFEGGHGVQKNAQQALTYYGLAAQQGNRLAQIKLAECYQDGIIVDRKNILETVRLYGLSGDQGSVDACYYLGLLYEYGAVGLRIDLQLAVQWYTKAVSAGEFENKELDDEDQNDWYRCSRARLRALKHNKK